MSSDRWTGAPLEVLLEILNWADAQTVAACLSVNRWWLAASSDGELWKALCEREFEAEARSVFNTASYQHIYKGLKGVSVRVKQLARDPSVKSTAEIYAHSQRAPRAVWRSLNQMQPPPKLVILGVERLRVEKEWAKLVRSPVFESRDFMFQAMALISQLHDSSGWGTNEYLDNGLERLAGRVREHLHTMEGEHSQRQIVEAMATVLFQTLKGNRENYYAAENSFLGCVLRNFTGIPIALSIVWILVAKKLGVEMQPVGFPCHFMISVTLPSPSSSSSSSPPPFPASSSPVLYIDPFEGKFETYEHLTNVLVDEFRLHDHASYLNPLDCRLVMARVLRNLIQVYATTEQQHRMLTLFNLVNLHALLEPNSRVDQELQNHLENLSAPFYLEAFRAESLRLRSKSLSELQARIDWQHFDFSAKPHK